MLFWPCSILCLFSIVYVLNAFFCVNNRVSDKIELILLAHSIMHLTVYIYLNTHMYAHTHTCIQSYPMFHIFLWSLFSLLVIPYPYCTFKWLLPGTAATFEECNWIHVASQQGHRWRSGSWSLRILVSFNKWHILIECFHH